MAKIYVLHENDAWVEPLREAFAELRLPYAEWFLDEGRVDFDQAPPEGVFYNRMSASSHTRGHRYAPELAHGVLNWLEANGRRVVNGSRALYLEVSKLAQCAALSRAGIRVPRTKAAVGREAVLAAARDFGAPFILKPNRGGRGVGVQLFQSVDSLAGFLDGPAYEQPLDGVWLIQEYVRGPEPFITRCEFVGGRFLYAVRVDASRGFDLCPADACATDGAAGVDDAAFCPAEAPPANRFAVVTNFEHPILERYRAFLRASGIEIAGIEFVTDVRGEPVTYDVNTNTNYNAQAEAEAQVRTTGMRAVARFLGDELASLSPRSGQSAAA